MRHPHVLILMCDQMQASRMGFVDGIAHTPWLDALAGEGVHFTNAITVHGQCVPSRCAFATGMSPHECGVMVNFGFGDHCAMLTDRHRTVFQAFREAGYTTALFGKSHMGPPPQELGFDVGDRLDGNFPEGREPAVRQRHRERMAVLRPRALGDESHHDYLRNGLDWLQTYEPGDKPLLFFFNTNLPHPPLYWEEEWRDRFDPDAMTLPRSYLDETFAGKPDFLRDRADANGRRRKDAAQIRLEIAQYYTLIAAVDKACGQIIDVFKAKGMWDDTLVLFTTDHGEMLGAHGITRKGTMPYEELYHIPCILKLPAGQTAARRVIDEPVISTDLPGALLDLAGIETTGAFADSGVTAALHRDAPIGDECVFFEHYAAWWGRHPFYGARTATMKYVRYYGDDDFEELYDLQADPDELHNLVHDPAYREQYADLSARADAWWRDSGGQPADYYETPTFKAGNAPPIAGRYDRQTTDLP